MSVNSSTLEIGGSDRHRVPTHLDEPDGVGKLSIRQLVLLFGSGLFVGPGAALLAPTDGPAIADMIRSAMPLSGYLLNPGELPLWPAAAWAAPVAVAGVLAIPIKPPPEHGVVMLARYLSSPKILGPRQVDELIGTPRVEGNVARVFDDYIAMWDMPSVSMRLASERARTIERIRWARFLNGLPCPIQTSVRATPVDLGKSLDAMVRHPNPMGARTAGYLRASAIAGGTIQRRRLLSIRTSDLGRLESLAQDIDGALARASLKATRITEEDLADALHSFWTRKPRKSNRIGPSTIAIHANALQIDGEWVTSFAQQRWPSAVSTDFMANMYDDRDAIDVVQTIWPQDQTSEKRKLEDKLFRLESTNETRSRKAAKRQLDLMLDALENHEEQVFGAQFVYLVRAPNEKELNHRARRVKQIADESGGEAASLKWEHLNGALTCWGVHEAPLLNRTRRVDTSSISRAYPLGASEIGLPDAIPWGKTLFGKRRVVWTPYARPVIPNPNIVLYATSGGGKGFAIKIYSARAILAGIFREAFFMDQAEEDEDGEYGRWARYLNGEIRKLTRDSWEADLERAVADIPNGTLPPAVVLNVAELGQNERCRAMIAFKRAVFERSGKLRAPRLFGLDELWTYATDREAAGEAEDVVRRGRHFVLCGAFLTQRPMDALDTSLGRTVQSQCGTRMYGMQSPSEISDVSQRLRWTDEQVSAVGQFGSGEWMMEVGLHRLAFAVDYTPEEYEMANTDYKVDDLVAA